MTYHGHPRCKKCGEIHWLYDDCKERLAPGGSTPASGSRTRVAAGDLAQSLFPSQLRRSRTKEERALGQAITLLMEQADNDEYQAMVYKDAKQKKEFRHFYKLAAVNRRAADILCEMLSLTQSAVDGAQGDCARCGQTHYDGVEKECHRKDCDFKERNRLKREKRSVSGNADGLGRRTLDADSK